MSSSTVFCAGSTPWNRTWRTLLILSDQPYQIIAQSLAYFSHCIRQEVKDTEVSLNGVLKICCIISYFISEFHSHFPIKGFKSGDENSCCLQFTDTPCLRYPKIPTSPQSAQRAHARMITTVVERVQGRSVVVVDVEAQWNIYSPNFVPGAYYPTFAIFSTTGIVLIWRLGHKCAAFCMLYSRRSLERLSLTYKTLCL